MARHAAWRQVEVLLQERLVHIIKMVKRYRRGFQQGRAGDAVREITLGERFRTNKQVVQRAEFIHQTAWQRLMLNTHRTDHLTTT